MKSSSQRIHPLLPALGHVAFIVADTLYIANAGSQPDSFGKKNKKPNSNDQRSIIIKIAGKTISEQKIVIIHIQGGPAECLAGQRCSHSSIRCLLHFLPFQNKGDTCAYNKTNE